MTIESRAGVVRSTPLAELSAPRPCAMCEGSGSQLELIWLGGNPWEEPEEREARCYGCDGYGIVVALTCGRCGEHDSAHPDEAITETRHCAACGHSASNALWLPMARDTEEKAG